MYSEQQIEQAHQTDFRAVLQHFGFNPISKTHFENPFKTEKNSASFSVFKHSNGRIWIANDLSESKIWRVMEFVKEFKKWDFKEAMKFLLSFNGQYSEPTEYHSSLSNPNEPNPLPQNKEATKEQIQNLDNYLKNQRGINPKLAKQYLQYRRYKIANKWYYALWFQNNSNGFAIRNKFFKGCFEASDITTIEDKNYNDWIIFEGFIDFLSAISYYKMPFKANILVLNSTSNLKKAIAHINNKKVDKTRVFCFLDNDKAGKKAFQELKEQLQEVEIFDKSDLYIDFNDFNDFLISDQSVK